jgi:hypothetical protein
MEEEKKNSIPDTTRGDLEVIRRGAQIRTSRVSAIMNSIPQAETKPVIIDPDMNRGLHTKIMSQLETQKSEITRTLQDRLRDTPKIDSESKSNFNFRHYQELIDKTRRENEDKFKRKKEKLNQILSEAERERRQDELEASETRQEQLSKQKKKRKELFKKRK